MMYDAEDLAALARMTCPLDAAVLNASPGLGTLQAPGLRPVSLKPYRAERLAEAQTRRGPLGTGHDWTPPAATATATTAAAQLKGLGDDNARGRQQLKVALALIQRQRARIAQLESALRAHR